jgi:hypothetical protein
MTLRSWLDGWLKFWFAPKSPIPVALFRILFGLLMLDAAIFHIGPDILDWFGPHAVTSADAVHQFWWNNEPHFDVWLIFPDTDATTYGIWGVFIVAAFMVTIGFKTRAAAIICALILISVDNRQPFALNGGDAMMRTLSGYLCFTEAGAAFSVDRMIQRWKNPVFGEDARPRPCAPWGQRMIQVQVSIAYWTTFCAKISGPQWLDGTAVYYATHLDDMIMNPMPLYDNLLFCKFMTYYTLFFEGGMGPLVWFRELRYFILAGTLVMHIGIDHSINLPVFEWIFMASFITFIYPEDLTKAMEFVKKQIYAKFGAATPLIYSGAVARQKSKASLIEGLDVFGRLSVKAAEGETEQKLTAHTAYGQLTGYDLFAWLTGRLPLLWIIYPFIGLPWAMSHKRPIQPQSEQVSVSQS